MGHDRTLSWAERTREESRLRILRRLREQADYSAPAAILQEDLERQGLTLSMAAVRTAVAWLNEQGLVIAQTVGDSGIVIATATEAGIDVASGRSLVPGVARIRPGEI